MDSIIKQQWLEDLTSGKYKQCNVFLKEEDSFCALGLLANQYSKAKGISWQRESDGAYSILGDTTHLPVPVFVWSDLDNHQFLDYRMIVNEIMSMNDNNVSFIEIAQWISINL